jgi:hypothetical protein
LLNTLIQKRKETKMHPKLFASLLKAIEDWSVSQCETREWNEDAPLWTKNADMNMAKAAAIVYDQLVESTREVEAEHA